MHFDAIPFSTEMAMIMGTHSFGAGMLRDETEFFDMMHMQLSME